MAKVKDELETVKQNEVAVINFEADAGLGNENVTGNDIAIPMLQVLQTNSPQVDEDNDKYIDGAKPGDLLDTASQTIYSKDKGIEIVFAAYFSEYVEWKPRDIGGGLAGRHPITSSLATSAKRDGGKLILANGNNLVETHYHIGVMKNAAGALTWVIVPMTSTKIPVSKKLNKVVMDARVNGVQPPRFANRILLKSVKQENAKGKFYNFGFDYLGLVEDAQIYLAAKELNAAFTAGKVMVPVEEPEAPAENSDY